MISSQAIDDMLEKDRLNPRYSKHNINSYITNLPISESNTELQAILKYFKSPNIYLPLYQDEEFSDGLTIELQVEMINQEDLEAGVTYRESLFHNHDFFEIVFVYRGQCPTQIGDELILLEAGDLCLLNLQTIHRIIIPDQESVVFNLLIGREFILSNFMNFFEETDFVSRFYLNSLFGSSSIDDSQIFTLKNHPEILFYLYHLIEEAVNKKQFFENMMLADLTSILLGLTRIHQSKIEFSAKSNGHQLEISDVLFYIQENYSKITLTDLAQHFNYSNRTMIRFIKKATNHNFSDIIKEFRLNSACHYLSQSTHTIDEIANITGFNSRSYFDKVFKQTFHMTPKNYRNKLSR